MTPAERTRFDGLLADEIDRLPGRVRGLLEEVAVVVEDRPSPELIRSLEQQWGEPVAAADLCGLHSGTPGAFRGPEASVEPTSTIYLFREGIVREAGGWGAIGAQRAIADEIRTTLLHEIGHEFGLDETDLDRLGYA